MSTNRSPLTALDKKSVDKFFTYNLNTEQFNAPIDDNSHITTYKRDNPNLANTANTLNSFFGDSFGSTHQTFNTAITYPTLDSFVGLETDSKQPTNAFKYSHNSILKKKKLMYKEWLQPNLSTKSDLSTLNPLSRFTSELFNKELVPKFKNLKSDDLQLLSSERNPRLLGNYNSSAYTHNFSKHENNTTSTDYSSQTSNVGTNQINMYNSSQLN
jgi:hypothetical protein